MSQLIHMGMSKSGSTFLQSAFFQNNSNFYFSGLYNEKINDNYYSIKDLHDLILSLVNLDSYDGLDASLIANIRSEFEKSKDLNKVFVYSNEHLCESVNPYFQAKIIKEIFHDPKILLVIRNQFDILKSHYFYQGNKLLFVPKKYRGKHVEFRDYFNYLIFTKEKRGGHKARDWIYDFLRIIDYEKFLSINEKIFGKENIIVMPFEKIMKNNNHIYNYLEKKIDFNFDRKIDIDDAPVRSSISLRGLKTIRFIKFFLGNYDLKDKKKTRKMIQFFRERFPNVHHTLTRGGSKFVIPDDIKAKISELFCEGNQKISKKYDLDLKSLGYPF